MEKRAARGAATRPLKSQTMLSSLVGKVGKSRAGRARTMGNPAARGFWMTMKV
jgi:hypothetical protein